MSSMNPPGSVRMRRALFALPLVSALAGVPPASANPDSLQASPPPRIPSMAAGTGAGIAGAVAGIPELAAGAPVAMSADTAAGEKPANGGREDLTVFFSIGVFVDLLLVTAFLVWAIGQWRKTRQ